MSVAGSPQIVKRNANKRPFSTNPVIVEVPESNDLHSLWESVLYFSQSEIGAVDVFRGGRNNLFQHVQPRRKLFFLGAVRFEKLKGQSVVVHAN